MKKYFYLLALVCTTGLFTACSDDDGDNEPKYDTVTFEGTYWDNLIDTNQGTGKLLYGESGSGCTSDEGVYEWIDQTTSLHSKLNGSADFGWAYWNGGVAVSHYECDIANGCSATQLSLPTGTGAHSGNNFVVAYGYNDGGWDCCPVIDFKDGVARKIKGLWVTNTAWLVNYEQQIATDNTYLNVTFEGFDANGASTGKVSYPIQSGKVSISDWRYVDLSTLGAIHSLKVNYSFSDDQKNTYGFAAPAYIAIDDVEIYK